jgi:transposase
MTQYPRELKESLIARMLPPHDEAVPALARETGIPKDTLYTWRLQHRAAHPCAPAPGAAPGGGLSGADKLAVVLRTASLNEHELSEYCRARGLYPQQIAAWRAQCEQANDPPPARAAQEQVRALARENRQLKSELQRKEKALAEAAALLVLQKKIRALWQEDEDATLASRSAAK